MEHEGSISQTGWMQAALDSHLVDSVAGHHQKGRHTLALLGLQEACPLQCILVELENIDGAVHPSQGCGARRAGVRHAVQSTQLL